MRKEIGRDEQLYAGDVVELHFSAYGPDWFKATQAAVVENAVKSRDEFEIIKANYWEPQKVIFTVEVKKTNPVVVTVSAILAALAVTAIAFGWMFDKAYKVTDSPTAQVGSVGILIVGIVLILGLLKKR